jgi:hypothetical protein
MMPSAMIDAMMSGQIGQPAAWMMANTRCLSDAPRAGRDDTKNAHFKPSTPLRQGSRVRAS